MAEAKIELFFDKGTLLLKGLDDPVKSYLPAVKWDDRVRLYRAPANLYRKIALTLHRRKIPFADHARDFEPLNFPFVQAIEPRHFQAEAREAWLKGGREGVVVLPTGAGKTILAVLLIHVVRRPTLVHVPTIDLMHQWHAVLSKHLDAEIGRMGGGYKDMAPITVTTYDSALMFVPHKGNRFGFAVFDEAHRLPGEQYRFLAISNMAPFRLGLTATPERVDGGEAVLYQLCGPLRYRAKIHDLTGGTLAPYEVVTIEVDMKPDERARYEEANQLYREFLEEENISISSRNGWKQFLWRTSRTPEGRRVFKAYRLQKQLSLASSAKEEWVWDLIVQHREDRILVFTQDNETAYRLGRKFLLPVLTHHTRPKERESFLEAFRSGDFRILVTSKVLNEGVDVPDANVAIIVSGSGSVREHVQRLGRILRGRPGKMAVLYELISADTREYFINKRRKRHHAYQGPDSIQGDEGRN
ncbi:MAG: helicase-related protein [Acidobacteriota bacterium]|nr:helicase-related protein [Acidobacteriota bacterium]